MTSDDEGLGHTDDQLADRVAVLLRIVGRVQGVGFRWSTVQQAEQIGAAAQGGATGQSALAGWVRNEPDGSVSVRVEGSPALVAALVDWCSEGPSWARVDRVERTTVRPEGLAGFRVR